MRRRHIAGAALTTVVTAGTAAWAGPQVSNAPEDSPKPEATPLSALINGVGIGQPIDPTTLTAFGWVEGSWTYDASHPPGNITPAGFMTRKTRACSSTSWGWSFSGGRNTRSRSTWGSRWSRTTAGTRPTSTPTA